MALDLAEQTCPCGEVFQPVRRGLVFCRTHVLWACQLRHRYALDTDTIVALLELKTEGCFICGSHHLLSIDHCHDTGNVRGWLCRKCNSGLGFFDDDVDRLRAAVKYMEGAI